MTDRRVVWITGGGNGIGRELVAELARRDWAVGVVDIDDEALARLRKEHEGLPIVALHADIADEDEVRAAYDRIVAELGPVDHLINNALYARNESLLELPLAEWRRSIDVGLTGYLICTKQALPGMIERGYGRIINMSSGSGERGIPGTGAYAATKGAMNAITRTLAVEIADTGVTVNTLTLGAVMTAGFEKLAVDDAGIEARRQRIPLGRFGTLADYIGTVELLLSRESEWITGAVFHVDGGANNAALVQQVRR